MTEIREVKGAKSLRYEIVIREGEPTEQVVARVVSLPMAEKIVPVVEEVEANMERAMAQLKEGLGA